MPCSCLLPHRFPAQSMTIDLCRAKSVERQVRNQQATRADRALPLWAKSARGRYGAWLHHGSACDPPPLWRRRGLSSRELKCRLIKGCGPSMEAGSPARFAYEWHDANTADGVSSRRPGLTSASGNSDSAGASTGRRRAADLTPGEWRPAGRVGFSQTRNRPAV